jgi:hypothetical protein
MSVPVGSVGGSAAARFCIHVLGIRQTGRTSIANPSLAGGILGRASDWQIELQDNGKKRRIIDIRRTGH